MFPLRLWYREKLDLTTALGKCPQPEKGIVFNHVNELVGYSRDAVLPEKLKKRVDTMNIGRTAFEIYYTRLLVTCVGREGVEVVTDDDFDSVKAVTRYIWHKHIDPREKDHWCCNADRCNRSRSKWKLTPFRKATKQEVFREQWTCAIMGGSFCKDANEGEALAKNVGFLTQEGFFLSMWQRADNDLRNTFGEVTANRNRNKAWSEEQCMLEVFDASGEALTEKLIDKPDEWRKRGAELLLSSKTTQYQLVQHFRTMYWPSCDVWRRVHTAWKREEAVAEMRNNAKAWWDRAAEKNGQAAVKGVVRIRWTKSHKRESN